MVTFLIHVLGFVGVFWALTTGFVLLTKPTSDSLSYKIIDMYDKTPSPNLCWFVWQLMFYTGLSFILLMVSLALLSLYLYGAVYFVLSLFGGNLGYMIVNHFGVMGIFFIFTALFLFIVIGIGFGEWKDYRKMKRGEEHHGMFSDSLAVQWIKAKKQKICPIIDFEEGKFKKAES